MFEKKEKKKAPKKRKKKARKNKKPSVLVKMFLGSILLVSLIVFSYLFYCYITMPDIKKAIKTTRQPMTVITADNGNEIKTFGNVYQDVVMIYDLPLHLIDAIISTEDRRFYSHFGFDFISFFRAMSINLISGRYAQGGSTITQQVAKNLFLTPNKNIKRKVQELMLALWLESKLSKDQILTLYVNRVYLGSGTYGISAASQKYFKKPASDLTLKESAVIAGLLKAPSRYSPLNDVERSEKRAKIVLQNMLDNSIITEKQMEDALKTSLKTKHNNQVEGAKHFADWLYTEANEIVGERDLDIIVYSTLDQNLQEKTQKILNNAIAKNKNANVSQGAIVIMENSGAIKAMVGGVDYEKNQFNRAVQAYRQAGSTFKTFVYLTALDKGYKASDIITDEEISIGTWKPTNFSNKTYGKISLEFAFMHSLNLATIRLGNDLGLSQIAKTAQKIGINSPIYKNPAMALGTMQVNVLEVASAYATIANGGFRVFPYAINDIYTKSGENIFHKQDFELRRVIDDDKNKAMIKLLEKVITDGTGKKANISRFAGGKTGTSNEHRDAWFVGFDDSHSVAVWLGNDDNSPMKKISGGSLPAEIWKEVMQNIH